MAEDTKATPTTPDPTSEAGVQAEQVSKEEQASKDDKGADAKTAASEQTPEQKMAAVIEQQVGTAVTAAVKEIKDLGRKELQSQQDKNKRLEARAKTAESARDTAARKLTEVDPEAAKDAELTTLRDDKATRLTADQVEEARRVQTEYATKLTTSLNAHIEALGIDPKDERIDWANDAKDFIEGRTKFDASIAKIIKEERETMQEGFDDRLKAVESKIKGEETEANSVETATSTGVVAGSDAEFMKLMGDGTLPSNKENLARYDKIKNAY